MTPIRTARPYAAKAIVEHEFDTDHLNIWVTFRFTMDQTVKPANGKWIVEVDEVAKAVTVSTWQDAWTILLTVPGIATLPDRVTLEYDGPNVELRTTWNKQWEPWGPILSTDATPLPFGSYRGNEIDWAQVAAQDVWYTVSDADISVGQVNKVVFQNNQELKIQQNGMYLLNYYITIECSIAGKHVLTAPEINGIEQPDGQPHKEFGRANEEDTLPGTAIFNLTVGDLVSIGVSTSDAGNPTLAVSHIGLTIIKIGGE